MDGTAQLTFVMVSSAQLRAARAYLGRTMVMTAAAAGLHRRTLIRLENEADRSTEYARAATIGAPKAVQVADRWHETFSNMREVTKEFTV